MKPAPQKIIVKIGTKVLTSKDRALDRGMLGEIVRQIADLRDRDLRVIVVTSGAIGAGMSLLGLKKRPKKLHDLQAAAAIGQSHLMNLYGGAFKERGYLVGQVLLTQEDFNDRARYLNIKHTLNALTAAGVVPIINENDTVATDEIRCGDNDRLSSLVADLWQADRLIILTDVDGLLDVDGQVIREVAAVDRGVLHLAGGATSDLGTGGMATKVEAARTVTGAGIACVIANGKAKDVIIRAASGDGIGTLFRSGKRSFIAKKRWIAFSSRPKGAIVVDDGAVTALGTKKRSLLASGISAVSGHFSTGATVSVTDGDGHEIARGRVNYSSQEIGKIRGRKSVDFKAILGRDGPDEVIHKDNLVVLEC